MSRGLPVESKYCTNPWFEVDESANNERLVESVSAGDTVTLTVDAARYGDGTERIDQQVVLECTTIDSSHAVLEHLPDDIVDAVDEDRFDSLQCTALAIDGRPIEGDAGSDADAARRSTADYIDIEGAVDSTMDLDGVSESDESVHPRDIEAIHSRVESGHDPTDQEADTLRQAIDGTWETRALATECLFEVASVAPSRAEELYPDAVEAALVTRDSRVVARALLHELAQCRSIGIPAQVLESDIERILDRVIELTEDIAAETPGGDDQIPAGGATAIDIAARLDARRSEPNEERTRFVLEALMEAVTTLAVDRARRVGLDPLDAVNELQERRSDGSVTAQLTDEGVVDSRLSDGESAQSYTRSLYDGIAAARLALLVESSPAALLRAEAVIAERIEK